MGALVPDLIYQGELASPALYVSAAGNDGATHLGTLADPLLTIQEAAKRLAAAGYTVEAYIRVIGALNAGANPVIDLPPPRSGAFPVCIQGVVTKDISNIACTGGTQGTSTGTIAGATFTSADASGANTQRGKILGVNAGPAIINTYYPIESNDGAGGFTVCAKCAAAPVAGNSFDVYSRASITWSGEFVLNIPGGGMLDRLELLPTGANATFKPVGTTLQTTGCKYTTAAANFIYQPKCQLESCNTVVQVSITSSTRLLWNPSAVTPCGDVYDGSAAAGVFQTTGNGESAKHQATVLMAYFRSFDIEVSNGSSLYLQGLCIFEDCGFAIVDAGFINMAQGRHQNARGAFAGAFPAVFTSFRQSVLQFASTYFASVAAAADLIKVDGSTAYIGGVSGAPSGAAKYAIIVINGGKVYGVTGGTAPTCTGGTVGNDVVIEGGVPFAIAQLVANNGGSSGPLPHVKSTDAKATIGAVTINKLSGQATMAAAAGSVVITNSLADVGDIALIVPLLIDATVGQVKAVCTKGFITVTAAAGPTANWSFAFVLIRVGV